MNVVRPQWVVGKRIAAVELNKRTDGGRTTYDPVFVLEGGARVVFLPDETDDTPGVTPYYLPVRRST